MGKPFSRYNAEQLALLEDFMRGCIDVFRQETLKLQNGTD